MTKRIVVPGEVLTEEKKRMGYHVFIEDGKIRAGTLGIYDDESTNASVVPLHGKYMPQRGDIVVGIIKVEQYNGYQVDLNSFSNTFVFKEDSYRPLAKGDVITGKILNVTEVNEIKLENIRAMHGGSVEVISPVKVPRLIGKNGSMIDAIKEGTGSKIIVGRNGWIWYAEGNEVLLKKTIRFVDENAHKSNLTNTVVEFLKKENK